MEERGKLDFRLTGYDELFLDVDVLYSNCAFLAGSGGECASCR